MTESTKEDTLFNLFYAVFRRRRAIIWLFAATVFFVMFFTYLITPRWEATTLILVEANPKRQLTSVPELSTPGPPTSPEVQAHNLAALLTGRNMAYQIVSEFELDKRLQQRKTEPNKPRDILKKGLIDVFRSPFLILQAMRVLRAPERDWVDEAADDLIDKAEDIEVEVQTQVINLTIRGQTPQLATDIANRMADLLQEKTLELSRSESQIAYECTRQELESTEEKLLQARVALRQFLEENVVGDLQEEKKQKIQKIEDLRLQYLQAKSGKEIQSALLEETQNQLEKRDPSVASSPLASDNPAIQQMQSELSRAEISLASALTEKTRKHPDVIRLEAEIERLKRLLSEENQRIARGGARSSESAYNRLLNRSIELETDVTTADDRLAALAGTIRESESALQELPAVEMELASLSNQVAVYEVMDRGLRARLEELNVLSNMSTDDNKLRVIERAHVSPLRNPDWPKSMIHFVVSLFFGAVIGIGYALFVEYWNDSFRRRQEIEQVLGVPVIGEIPPADGV
ncbi:MAG: Wzz/FepE/Etk N-terminal domain-containing protein [Candidatus Eisenbacteria bacterium]